MCYLYCHDYDPLTARFTAKDPLGYAAGDSDVYGYCLDNPVDYIDPNGLELRVYNRKANGSVGNIGGNHAYLHSTDENRTSGMGASWGTDSNVKEHLKTDSYNVVPNPKGLAEKDVLDHMDKTKNDYTWIPYWNDCHEAIDTSLGAFELKNPGAPGGRLGEIPSKRKLRRGGFGR